MLLTVLLALLLAFYAFRSCNNMKSGNADRFEKPETFTVDKMFNLKNYNLNKCYQHVNGKIEHRHCDVRNPAQAWYFEGQNIINIPDPKNKDKKMCLAVDLNTHIITAEKCNINSPYQRWDTTQYDREILKNLGSQKCIDVNQYFPTCIECQDIPHAHMYENHGIYPIKIPLNSLFRKNRN